jgi:beta-galactosidase
LLSLRPVTGWSCSAQDDDTLLAFADGTRAAGERIDLPLALDAGTEVWLDVDLPAGDDGWLVRLDGAQIRATAWAAGECLGRVWLADPARPRFSGGDPGVLWVPACWTAAGSRLTLLLRATAGPEAPALTAIGLTPAKL